MEEDFYEEEEEEEYFDEDFDWQYNADIVVFIRIIFFIFMEIFSTGYTVSTMLASVGTNGQTFFADVAPVITFVVGIVVVLALIPRVISWFKHIGRSSARA